MYCPPACGNSAASSPKESAAETVSNPVRTQVSSSPTAEPVCRVMSAATMKMPEPIIDPTTIIVPSKRPMARTKPVSCFVATGSWMVCVVSAIFGYLHGRRAIRLAQHVEVLPGTLARIPREQNVANHRHAVGTRVHHRLGSLQCDSPDSHDRLVRHRADFPDQFHSNHRIGIRFRCRRKYRPHRDVIRRRRYSASKLLQIVRGCADPHLFSYHGARLLSIQIVLADVHAFRTGEGGHIRAIVHNQCPPGRSHDPTHPTRALH